jgi:hypothetical protein
VFDEALTVAALPGHAQQVLLPKSQRAESSWLSQLCDKEHQPQVREPQATDERQRRSSAANSTMLPMPHEQGVRQHGRRQ